MGRLRPASCGPAPQPFLLGDEADGLGNTTRLPTDVGQAAKVDKKFRSCQGHLCPRQNLSQRSAHPWLRHIFADCGYTGDKLRQALRKIGKWTVEIIVSIR